MILAYQVVKRLGVFPKNRRPVLRLIAMRCTTGSPHHQRYAKNGTDLLPHYAPYA